jgi:polysaccharide biosynthesis/export protein
MHSGIPDHRVRRLLRLLGLLALSGAWLVTPRTVAAQRPAADSVKLDSVRPVGTLRPGDELNILVFRNTEISGKYLIDAQGRIHLPGVGNTQVAGLEPVQVEERIRVLLTELGPFRSRSVFEFCSRSWASESPTSPCSR